MFQPIQDSSGIIQERDRLSFEMNHPEMGAIIVRMGKDNISVAFEKFERDYGGPVVDIDLSNEDGVPHVLVFDDPADEDPIELDLRAYAGEA